MPRPSTAPSGLHGHAAPPMDVAHLARLHQATFATNAASSARTTRPAVRAAETAPSLTYPAPMRGPRWRQKTPSAVPKAVQLSLPPLPPPDADLGGGPGPAVRPAGWSVGTLRRACTASSSITSAGCARAPCPFRSCATRAACRRRPTRSAPFAPRARTGWRCLRRPAAADRRARPRHLRLPGRQHPGHHGPAAHGAPLAQPRRRQPRAALRRRAQRAQDLSPRARQLLARHQHPPRLPHWRHRRHARSVMEVPLSETSCRLMCELLLTCWPNTPSPTCRSMKATDRMRPSK